MQIFLVSCFVFCFMFTTRLQLYWPPVNIAFVDAMLRAVRNRSDKNRKIRLKVIVAIARKMHKCVSWVKIKLKYQV